MPVLLVECQGESAIRQPRKRASSGLDPIHTRCKRKSSSGHPGPTISQQPFRNQALQPIGQQPSPHGWPLPRTHSALGVKRSKRATRNAANGKEVICDEHTVFATTKQTNKANQTNAKPIQQPLRGNAGTCVAKNSLASQWI
jgi:hypothetical protein